MSGQRELYSQSGILGSFDGSACVSMGGTLAYASLLGPGDLRHSGNKERLHDQTTVEIQSRTHDRNFTSRILSGPSLESLSSALIATDYPRTHTSLQLQMGEDDGSYASASVNAGTLALMDSGAALRYLPGAISLAITSEGQFILDPDKITSDSASALFLFVFESKSQQLLSSSLLKGRVSIKVFNKALQMAREASRSVFEFYRRAAEKKFSKDT
eukprot:TRINITY_DN4816_c0_g2_i1.p1 TRINITY_DN4816_c0_g2~~TRINITY_DN4816_c0_g2_i1.p1  ORF type:complete len:215 (-),score=42.09 TRINITY_DN4816_c0_g2_i1:39-683(-)